MAPLWAPAPRAWLAVATLLALGAVVLWPVPAATIDWQPQLAVSQPWRVWSAAFVHLSPLHLGANLLGCAAVAAFGAAARLPRHGSWTWLAAWPLTHAALIAQPQLTHYGGLSGVLHAGVAVGALHLVWRERGKRLAIGWAVLAGMALKLLLEAPWAGPTRAAEGWDFAIAPLGHLTGAVSGLACGTMAQVLANRRAGTGGTGLTDARRGRR